MSSFYEKAVKVFNRELEQCKKLDDALDKCKEYEPFIYPPARGKLFNVYISEGSTIAINADKWEKEEDSLVFYKNGEIIAWFNSNNIAGICEGTNYFHLREV